jgi:hypothetical protein
MNKIKSSFVLAFIAGCIALTSCTSPGIGGVHVGIWCPTNGGIKVGVKVVEHNSTNTYMFYEPLNPAQFISLAE